MSQDDDLGIQQQIADCRVRARELGLPVGKVYEDNDASAFKENRARPAFEELLRDLSDGVISGVIVYALDRIARQPIDLEQLIEVYDRAPRPLFFVSCIEEIGLTRETDRSRARDLVRAAHQESANLARRVARSNRSHAETGKAHKGGRRPFGWAADGIRIDPFEAELIRQAHRDLLTGASVSSVRRQWIEAGVTPLATKRSGDKPRQINHRSVRDRLINPRLCGYRVYLPQSVRESLGKAPWLPDHIVRDRNGEPVLGDWKRIAEPVTWQKVVDLLDGRKKAKERAPHSTEVRYFLSGIVQCGICGTGMRPSSYLPGSRPAQQYGFRYVCRAADGGCAGVSRIGPMVDSCVQSQLLDHLRVLGETAERDIARWTPASPAAIEQIRTVEGEMRFVWGLRAADALPQAEFEERRHALRTQVAEHFVALRTVEAQRRRRAESLPALVETWDTLPVAARRRHFLQYATHAVIHPAGRGNRFDPALVEVGWRTDESWTNNLRRSKSTLQSISLISDSMTG
jgi:DNA invertase Pin-like site-specific DNA recombinase